MITTQRMTMRRTATGSIAALVCIGLLAGCQGSLPNQPSAAARPPVLMAVFAHPDDEASVAAVLAKYAQSGTKVYLITATDGRLGVSPHAGIPAGDELAAVRAKELQCAAEKLGLQPPLMLGLHDQLKMGEGLAKHGEQINELRARVTQAFEDIQPDAVITWGPSGWTGHPDHRLVSGIVTEVFQARAWERPAQLYYPAVPTGKVPPQNPFPLATVDAGFLSTRVAVSPQDYARAKDAWLCHKSQYTPEQIEQLQLSLVAAQQGVAHFQPAVASVGRSDSLLR